MHSFNPTSPPFEEWKSVISFWNVHYEKKFGVSELLVCINSNENVLLDVLIMKPNIALFYLPNVVDDDVSRM